MNKNNNNNPPLERNLRRQLKQAGLSPDVTPTQIPLEDWQAFLHSVNRSYVGNKETRYILEKSLDESSVEMRKLYDDLKEETDQRVKALQESEQKTRFMANMSHEIRTPMNGILGSLEIVQNSTKLNGTQQKFIGTAFTSAENLLDIINNILDYSKISVDQLGLESVTFDLYQLVEDINNIASVAACDKRINLRCMIAREVPTHLKGDPTKIRQILSNLLNNAVKFTHQGEVSTHIRLLQQTNRNSKIRFEVEDTGIGIPKNMQQNIFDAFIQQDASTTRQYGGTGLGLTIVKELTQMMRGEISVASVEGKGSRFWVDISFEKAVTEESTDMLTSGLAGLRVLAVDSVMANLAIIEHYLTQWGLEIETASSGEKALQLLQKTLNEGKRYHMMIVDSFIPEHAGLRFSQTINTSPYFADIPKVILNSTNMGCDYHATPTLSLTKPIRKAMLKKVLLECLPHQENSKCSITKEKANKSLHKDDVELGFLHDEYLKYLPQPVDILLAEDNEVNALITMTMMKQMGLTVKHVTNGKQAFEALKKHNYKMIVMDMHMPIMDGYQATRKIRAWEDRTQTTATPIIALTANALIGDREKCLTAGMDDYLSKPIRQEGLKNLVAKWVKQEQEMMSI